MPAWDSSAPRKKLPPPMTTATCVPLATTSASWRAMPLTITGSTPTLPPPIVSPESLSSTRLYPRPSAGAKAVGADSGASRLAMSVNGSSLTRSDTGNPAACRGGGPASGPGRTTGPVPRMRSGAGGWPRCRVPSRACERRGQRGPASGSGLTDLEAGEAVDRQAGLVQDLLHGALGLGDRRLLEQDEVLVVGVDPTLDDLHDRLLGLALLLGGLLGDPALGLHGLGRDLVAGEVARARGSDVHRQAARRVLAAAAVLHRDTDGRRQVGGALVQVGGRRAVEDDEPGQHQLLADARRLGLAEGGALLPVVLGGQQRVDVGRLLLQHDVEQTVGQLHEVGVLGDEVGLAVELEQRAVLADDDAVRGGALEALADVLGALDPQELDGLVVVAVGLGERLLAVHHAGAGGVAETLDVGGGEVSHVLSFGCPMWCATARGVRAVLRACRDAVPTE